MELPYWSNVGLNTPIPILYGIVPNIPPPTPLFDGIPTVAAYSPLKLYMPHVAIIAVTIDAILASHTLILCSSSLHLLAKNNPILAISTVVISIEHCLKYYI